MWRMLGPALLFSGAAIGTSHLFQSTRAGAGYGLALVAVILIACLLRYPAFRFGVDYGHSAKQSLVAGYRELGAWAPLLFAAATLAVVPTIFAALSSATAGITLAVFDLGIPVPTLALILLGLCALLLLFGGYDWLDKINRLLMAFLVVSTIITTLIVLPQVKWATLLDVSWTVDPKALLFVVALTGFMPNALDVAIAQSMWTAEAEQQHKDESPVTLSEARGAFAAGYTLTAIMAVCFCIMGAGVMHSEGIVPETSAPGLAGQIVGLYSAALGEWAAVIAAVAALSVMFTTLLVSLDVGGRNVATTWQTIRGASGAAGFTMAYRVTLPVLLVCAASVLFVFTDSFTAMLDLATSSSFVAAPVIASLNHLAVTRCAMPEEDRPGRAIRRLSLAGIVVMTGLAITFFLL